MTIERDIFRTYLSVIKGSVGTNMFRHFYARIDGEETDTMEDGLKACAFYVSSVLAVFGVLDKPHSLVSSLVAAIEKAGWQKVESGPEPGDVLVWEPARPTPEDEPIDHIGFYIGEERAISNLWRERTPGEHDWLFRGSSERQVVAIYRGKHLMPVDVKTVEN